MTTQVRSWLIVKRIVAEFFEDSIPTVAGGITFFFLLALFPAIACIVSLYGLLADRAMIANNLTLLADFLPGGAVSILDAELHRLVSQKFQELSLAFFASLIIAVWSASGGYKALVDGLNVAYEVKETRGFVSLTVNALLFTIAAILLVVGAIYLIIHYSLLGGGNTGPSGLFVAVKWLVSFFLCAMAIAVVYHYGPNRGPVPWHWISWGSATASFLWLVGTRLFTWYVLNYGSYDQVYGNLGAAVGFLTWVWLSLVVLLLGAEINCELERTPNASAMETQRMQYPIA